MRRRCDVPLVDPLMTHDASVKQKPPRKKPMTVSALSTLTAAMIPSSRFVVVKLTRTGS